MTMQPGNPDKGEPGLGGSQEIKEGEEETNEEEEKTEEVDESEEPPFDSRSAEKIAEEQGAPSPSALAKEDLAESMAEDLLEDEEFANEAKKQEKIKEKTQEIFQERAEWENEHREELLEQIEEGDFSKLRSFIHGTAAEGPPEYEKGLVITSDFIKEAVDANPDTLKVYPNRFLTPGLKEELENKIEEETGEE